MVSGARSLILQAPHEVATPQLAIENHSEGHTILMIWVSQAYTRDGGKWRKRRRTEQNRSCGFLRTGDFFLSAHNGSTRRFDFCEYEPLTPGLRCGNWLISGVTRVKDRDGLSCPSSRSLSEYSAGISRSADCRILELNTLCSWCFCTRPRMIW